MSFLSLAMVFFAPLCDKPVEWMVCALAFVCGVTISVGYVPVQLARLFELFVLVGELCCFKVALLEVEGALDSLGHLNPLFFVYARFDPLCYFRSLSLRLLLLETRQPRHEFVPFLFAKFLLPFTMRAPRIHGR